MKIGWTSVLGVLLLGIAAVPKFAQAAPSTKKPAAVKVKKPKVKAVKKAKAPALPVKPPADIPVVTEAASVWEGCLESRDLPMLASKLGIEENRLAGLLSDEALLAGDAGECTPYVAATGGEGGVASATFHRVEPEADKSPVVAVRKTADGVTVTPGACDCPEPVRRVLAVSAKDFSDPSNEVMAGISREVRWQVGIVAPQMLARWLPERAPVKNGQNLPVAFRTNLVSGPLQAEPGTPGEEAFTVRMVLQQPRDGTSERLESIEINDASTGKRLDGAWWLDRPGAPGVLIGMEGVAYERLLWQSPVKYVMKTRGVGPSITTVRQKVKAPKGSSKTSTWRFINLRVNHLGVDMLAPKGLEVHAVGDATVSFAGRLGGFGNLVILDHGRGYQTYYAHLSAFGPGIKVGTVVTRGEVIGLVGSTGHSTAPHLHFETRKDGKYLDPFDEGRQLGFWLLTADDQERLAMELLAQAAPAGGEPAGDRKAARELPDVSSSESPRR